MLEKYQAKTAGPLTVLGFVFLAAFSTPIIFPNLRSGLVHLATALQIAIWIVFIANYVVCIYLASDRRLFIKSNRFGLACVLLPIFEPFRALRALAVVIFAAKKRGASKRRSLITTTSIVAFATWFFAGLAVTEAERHAAEHTIANVGDGWWWAITTMATVGYGDTYPVTTSGRAVGAILMIMGIALIGTMTATIASYFTEIFGVSTLSQSHSESEKTDDLHRQIKTLQDRITELEHDSNE
jgi:voltage-gated potassium channel